MVFLKSYIEYSFLNLNRLRINYYSGVMSTPHKVNMHSTKNVCQIRYLAGLQNLWLGRICILSSQFQL